ncbi:MAG: type II toxin-antitoxin system RelE/ParE family toxin [Parachlamydiaceae bacterium]
MLKEFVVYEGTEFTIEWYYNKRGKSPAKTYFDGLDRERKLEAFELFMTMAKIGKILNITKFRNEGEGIYAFKPKPDRFLCFFYSGKKIIITNAFEKKQEKLSSIEKKKALTFQKDYKARVKEGTYYG